MKLKLASLLALSILAARPLCAGDGPEEWAAEYRRSFEEGQAQAFAAHRPAPFASDLAARLGESEFSALGAEDAAQLALRLAASLDADLRLGRTFQEALARSAQLARIILRDALAEGASAAQGLQRMRSRASAATARARAGFLAAPPDKGPGSFSHGWARR